MNSKLVVLGSFLCLAGCAATPLQIRGEEPVLTKQTAKAPVAAAECVVKAAGEMSGSMQAQLVAGPPVEVWAYTRTSRGPELLAVVSFSQRDTATSMSVRFSPTIFTNKALYARGFLGSC